MHSFMIVALGIAVILQPVFAQGGGGAVDPDSVEVLRLSITGSRCEGRQLAFACQVTTGRPFRQVSLRYGDEDLHVIGCRHVHPTLANRTVEFQQAIFSSIYSHCTAAMRTGQQPATFLVNRTTRAMSGTYKCSLLAVNNNSVLFATSNPVELTIGPACN